MPKHGPKVDTPYLRTPDMYQIENDAPISEYPDKALDLIADARNGGIPDGANAFCSVGKEKRMTVQIQLFARINVKTDTFEEVGFRSHGCLAAIACGTVLASKLEGLSIDEALRITRDEIDEACGGLPPSRNYTLYFAIEAVKALCGDYYLRVKHFDLAQLNEKVSCEHLCMECLLTEDCSLRDSRVDQEMRERGEID